MAGERTTKLYKRSTGGVRSVSLRCYKRQDKLDLAIPDRSQDGNHLVHAKGLSLEDVVGLLELLREVEREGWLKEAAPVEQEPWKAPEKGRRRPAAKPRLNKPERRGL